MSSSKALRDSDLADFVAHGAGRASVIVEARRDTVAPSQTRARRPATDPREQLPPSAKSRAGRTRVVPVALMRELEAALRRLGLVERARRNKLAGSFVLEVTPDELRQLADQPAVQAIRLNRFHRRVAASQ